MLLSITTICSLSLSVCPALVMSDMRIVSARYSQSTF